MTPDKLKKQLEKTGIKLHELADAMGTTTRHVYFLLQGKYENPNWKSVRNALFYLENNK